MTPKFIWRVASLIGIAILAEMAYYYLHSMEGLLAGLLYLMAADVDCIFCVCFAARLLSVARERSIEREEKTVLQHRLVALLFVACQFLIVGTLNSSAVVFQEAPLELLLDYSAMIVFFFLSYGIVSMSDAPSQAGGYVPFNFIGHPRSRRFLFAIFAGYCTVCPLTIMSMEVSLIRGRWHPKALAAPEASLLTVALMASVSWGLLTQRYRGSRMPSKAARKMFAAATLLFALSIGAIQVMLSLSGYVYTLSMVAIGAVIGNLYYLWTANGVARSTDLAAVPRTADR